LAFRKKAWGQKEMFVKYSDVKKTQDLPSTREKNGETNKIICIQLLLNQNMRAVPKV
jgi:hypothetical protein